VAAKTGRGFFFGDYVYEKDKRGFERCCYLRLLRYGLQAYFTFLVSNLNRIVKLLTGITLRPQAKGRWAEKLVLVYSSLP